MALILDTLLYAQRLQQVGVRQDQAEAHAEIARDMVLAEVVSRDDLKTELSQLRSEIGALEQRLVNRVTLLVPGFVIGTVTLLGAVVTLYFKFLGK